MVIDIIMASIENLKDANCLTPTLLGDIFYITQSYFVYHPVGLFDLPTHWDIIDT